MLKDFNLFDNSGRIDYEANFFLADFIIADEEVGVSISDSSKDFFSSAKELYIHPQLFAFKIYSMMRRGYAIHSPIDLDSRYLKK
jgi:hypothetical protein